MDGVHDDWMVNRVGQIIERNWGYSVNRRIKDKYDVYDRRAKDIISDYLFLACLFLFLNYTNSSM